MTNSDLIKEFMALEEKERDAIFKLSPQCIPSIETRAKLLVALPKEEVIRLIEVTLRNQNMFYCLESISKIDSGKKYLLDIFPEVSSKRLASIMFEIGGFSNWVDIFNLLPVNTTVDLINYAVGLEAKEKNHHTFYVFYPTKFLVATEDTTAINILDKINPVAFKGMISETIDIGQEKFFTQVSILSNERIAELCNILPVSKVYKIVSKIQDDVKKGEILLLLSQKSRDYFFTKNTKGNKRINVLDSEFVLKNLPLTSKRKFVKEFPESSQINDLSLVEKLECIFS